MSDWLSAELKPDFPSLVDEGSGFDYQIQTMSEEETNELIEEFSEVGDIDVAIQNMALTIRHLASLLNT